MWGTATSGSDFIAEDLEVELPANQETVSLTFQTRNDTEVEADESYGYYSSNPNETYAIGSPKSALGIIESNVAS